MHDMKLVQTGVPNLDAVLGGGVPAYSLNIIAGQPGTGKTILAQQMLFHDVRSGDGAKMLYLTTLSEPTLKVVRYMQHFSFFDAEAFGEQVLYRDLGPTIRTQPLTGVTDQILEWVETIRPALLVIDSFKAISDLSVDASEFRLFCYDLSIRLASARCTTFLVGEYSESEVAQGAEFAVADGILYMDIDKQDGERRRFFQALKLRGQDTDMAPYPFSISSDGIHILSPALTLHRRKSGLDVEAGTLETGIPGLDALLRGGIPRGRTLILSGVSGTGKTTFALQFLVQGALHGERGILFSFEESVDRLERMAESFGWSLVDLQERGLLRIIFIPQTEIRVEENLETMVREVEALKPQRFAVDSFSVFLHKVEDPAVQREKTFQLATLVQRAGAVGLLLSDIPSNEPLRLSRFGVEETVVDGTIVLSSEMVGLRRRRYAEVYKMRAAAHVPGRHRMEIGEHGIEIFHASRPQVDVVDAPLSLAFEPVNGVLRGDLPYGSAWLVQGEPGVGKTTLSYQFAIEGLRRREAVLYVTADGPEYQVRQSLQGFGFLPDPYMESGQLQILDAFTAKEGQLDLGDPEAFLFAVLRSVSRMPKPLRVVFDSLTPLALGYSSEEFVALVHRKNRLLRQPNVTILDTALQRTLEESKLYSLLNAFDIVLDLYTPSWGDMGLSGSSGYRALRVHKARGASADSRPYPYTISPTEGIVVSKDFYRRQSGA